MGYYSEITKESKEVWTKRYEEIKLTLYKLYKSGITPRELSHIVNADLVDILELCERKDKGFLELWEVSVNMEELYNEHPFDIFVDAVQNKLDRTEYCQCCGQEVRDK